MIINIVLEGKGGELDHAEVTIQGTATETISSEIYNAIQNQDWMLAPGDTIRIEEVTE